MTRARLAGLVLAGGGSTRFGTDKALVEIEGSTLLERAMACLREVCDGPVLVASGDGVSRPDVGDGQVADLVPDAGPLSAVGAGLAALAGEAGAVAVLAVDHLAPSPGLLRLLAEQRGDAVCAYAVVTGRAQPLHAVWSTAHADVIARTVAAGERSVLRWLGSQVVVEVDEGALRAGGVDPAATHDIDVPADLD